MDPPAALRALPLPTDEQYRAFAKHVGGAHSWYKHLPLLTGGQFVVFLAPDAGVGRLVARYDGTVYHLETPPAGPEFTEMHPRLHYSWETTAEYRRRFGYLDYGWRDRDDQPFARDAGDPIDLPAAIRERCSFTLFPYVSDYYAESDVVLRVHAEAVRRLRAGEAHPQRDTVLVWARLAEALEQARERLTEADFQVVRPLRRGEVVEGPIPPVVHRYLAVERELHYVCHRRLRPAEMRKIRSAVAALRACLEVA
jgi:hypothetical protein